MAIRQTVVKVGIAGMVALSLSVGGCAAFGGGRDEGAREEKSGGFLGIGGKRKTDDANTGAVAGEIGVNSYLWRSTLDTLAFMPLTSADPYGGVIITDWYVNPEAPAERFKATVYILDSRLRADGLKVRPAGSMRRQRRRPRCRSKTQS
jgi:hypothetical protein